MDKDMLTTLSYAELQNTAPKICRIKFTFKYTQNNDKTNTLDHEISLNKLKSTEIIAVCSLTILN